jgi:hypothetical protein
MTRKEIGEAVERLHGRKRSPQATDKLVSGMLDAGLIAAVACGGFALPAEYGAPWLTLSMHALHSVCIAGVASGPRHPGMQPMQKPDTACVRLRAFEVLTYHHPKAGRCQVTFGWLRQVAQVRKLPGCR